MTIEARIRAISDDWDGALVSNDADAVAAFMADDWVFVGPDGVTEKRDLIDWIATGRLAHHSMRITGPVRIAVYDDVAVMTARKASTGAWEGTPYAADEWITDVYVRAGDAWPCVLSQKAPVEP